MSTWYAASADAAPRSSPSGEAAGPRTAEAWAKAGWVALVIFVPVIGVLAYLVARGGHLAGEQASDYGSSQDEAYRTYARSEKRGRHSADELTKLADLRDRGIITDEEFQRGKVQLLS